MNMKYLEKIVLIDAGWPHSLAVDKDGFVWAWGGNYVGQVGDGTDIDRITPVKVNGGEMETDQLESIVKVAAGRSGEYSLACDGTGHVWAWGNNYIGQLGNGKDEGDYPPSEAYELEPVQVVDYTGSGVLADVIDVDAGALHSIALDNTLENGGYVWCWGLNSSGQLGNDGQQPSNKPVKVLKGEMVGPVTYLEDIVDIAACCGYDTGGSSYAVDSSDYVWAWGNGFNGKLGQGDTNYHATPVKVKGKGGEGYLGDIVAVSGGNEHALALDKSGYVWAWGDNIYGQLGQGDRDDKNTPVKVQTDSSTYLPDIVFIDAGYEHSMAIDSDGNIWVWGRNQYSQLGLGYTVPNYEWYATAMP